MLKVRKDCKVFLVRRAIKVTRAIKAIPDCKVLSGLKVQQDLQDQSLPIRSKLYAPKKMAVKHLCTWELVQQMEFQMAWIT